MSGVDKCNAVGQNLWCFKLWSRQVPASCVGKCRPTNLRVFEQDPQKFCTRACVRMLEKSVKVISIVSP